MRCNQIHNSGYRAEQFRSEGGNKLYRDGKLCLKLLLACGVGSEGSTNICKMYEVYRLLSHTLYFICSSKVPNNVKTIIPILQMRKGSFSSSQLHRLVEGVNKAGHVRYLALSKPSPYITSLPLRSSSVGRSLCPILSPSSLSSIPNSHSQISCLIGIRSERWVHRRSLVP